MNEHLVMLGRFVRSPRTVGAVSPSSRALSRALIAELDLATPMRLIELGPGTGVVTREIVARLGPQAHCLAVEIDPAFVEAIARKYSRVQVVCGSAVDLERLAIEHDIFPADHIVSGLPFASLPAAITVRILDAIAATLRPGGTFTTFQYAHGYPSPLATSFRRALSDRLGVLPTRRLIWRNVPPAYVLTWRRPQG